MLNHLTKGAVAVGTTLALFTAPVAVAEPTAPTSVTAEYVAQQSSTTGSSIAAGGGILSVLYIIPALLGVGIFIAFWGSVFNLLVKAGAIHANTIPLPDPLPH